MQNHERHRRRCHRCHPFQQEQPIQYHFNGRIHSFAAIGTSYLPRNHCSHTESRSRQRAMMRCFSTIESASFRPENSAQSQRRGTADHPLSPPIVPTSLLPKRRLTSPPQCSEFPSQPSWAQRSVLGCRQCAADLLPPPILREQIKERKRERERVRKNTLSP